MLYMEYLPVKREEGEHFNVGNTIINFRPREKDPMCNKFFLWPEVGCVWISKWLLTQVKWYGTLNIPYIWKTLKQHKVKYSQKCSAM